MRKQEAAFQCDPETGKVKTQSVHKSIKTTNLAPPLARRPSSEFSLSADEKKLLHDPDWIDEEEAALIRAMRAEKTYGLEGEDIRAVARRHGRDGKA